MAVSVSRAEETIATGLSGVGVGVLDDRTLVLAFQAGRPAAYDEIYRRYHALARHVCLRMLGNPHDAEEAAQETMMRVFQGLSRFNGRYMLQPWVARIATNVSLDLIRARACRPQAGDPLDDVHAVRVGGPDQDPSVVVERVLESDAVRSVLSDLPERHREALVLREFEGRSHQEIGDALGVSPSQAKALIHRAKGSFRRAWDRDEERRGLGVLVPWLLAPLRAADWLRRLFGSATEAAATTSASPAAATTAISAGERVTAAAVAVLMATTVGVGAVALRHRSTSQADKQQAPVVAPSPSAPVVPAALPQRPEPKTKQEPKHQGRAKVAADASPATEVVAAVSPTPPPSPTDTGTPPPSVGPVPPPPPAWSAALSWSIFGNDIQLSQVDSPWLEGSVGRGFLFSQATTGSFTDSHGTAHGLYLEYWGSANGGDGTASTWVFVDTPDGRYRYDGSLSLTAATLADDGTSTYVFTGSYALADTPESTGDLVMPHDGAVTLVLHFWSDETSLYEASLSLVEAS